MISTIPLYCANRPRSLDTCLRSLEKNSALKHDVLLMWDTRPRPIRPSEHTPEGEDVSALVREKWSDFAGQHIRVSVVPQEGDEPETLAGYHRRMADAVNRGAKLADTPWISTTGNTDMYFAPDWDINLFRHASPEPRHFLAPVFVADPLQHAPQEYDPPGMGLNRYSAYWQYPWRRDTRTGREVRVQDRSQARFLEIHEREFLGWCKSRAVLKPDDVVVDKTGTRDRVTQYCWFIRTKEFLDMGGLPAHLAVEGHDDVWNDFDAHGAGHVIGAQDSIVLTTHSPVILDPTIWGSE